MTSKNNGSKTSTSTTLVAPAIEVLKGRVVKVGETDSGLITVNIQLRKFNLTVIEADGFFRFKLSSFVTNLLKDLGDSKEYEDVVRRNMITEVWAPLRTCSAGEVPDRDQFLAMPKSDIAFWVETAKELGHEFTWLDGLNRIYQSGVEKAEAEKDDLKKKEPSP